MIDTQSVKLIRTLSIALCFLPAIFLFRIVIDLAVDVPFGDSWAFIPVLEKSYGGHLSVHDLWAQHNEHRVLISGAIFVALARATHWNTFWEVALTVFLGVAIFAVLTAQLRRTVSALQSPGLWWVLPCAAVAAFSAAQYENWLWGWQFSLLLSVFVGVCTLLLLTHGELGWKKVSCAGVMSLVATYTFAYGLTLWPIGAVLLVLGRAGRRKVIAWGMLSLVTFSTYLFHYEKPAVHPPMTVFLQHPLGFISYILKGLGGICAQLERYPSETTGQLAFVTGAFLLGGMVWVVWIILSRRLASFGTLLPFLALSSYSLCNAILTAIGRLGMGSDQAVFSRYCTAMVPIWVSFLICLMIVLQKGDPIPRTAAFWLLILSVSGLVLGSISALEPAKVMSASMAVGRRALFDLMENPQTADVTAFDKIYSDPNVVIIEARFLSEHHLSLFRE